MKSPFFSIVIPIYKVEQYLACCIDSILHQSFQDFELLLIDDGSPDKCPAICDDYKEKDVRINVLHKQNMGLSEARNDGIRMAKGVYIIFLDSDDFHSSSDFLLDVYNKLKTNPVELLLFQRCRFIDGEKTFSKPKRFTNEELAEHNYNRLLHLLSRHGRLDANASLKVISRKFLIDADLFFTRGIYSEDVEWFVRLVLSAKSVAVSNVLSYCYRIREGSISHTVSQKHIDDLLFIIRKAIDDTNKVNDKDNSIVIYNLLAYYYFIVLGFCESCLSKELKNSYFGKCSKYKWLANYTLGNKLKLCALVLNVFGVKLTAKIMGLYIKMK